MNKKLRQFFNLKKQRKGEIQMQKFKIYRLKEEHVDY